MIARRLLAASCLLFAVGIHPAAAAPIIVCNTGQAVGCVGSLPDNSLDSNYQIIAGPVAGTTKVVATDGFPLPSPWVPNDADSKWIGPSAADNDSTAPVGTYTYRTTFSLEGMDSTTASISGFWATDNNGVDVLINGMSTGQTTCFACFGQLAAFAITSGFVSGLNTLDFVLTNGGGPTGLRVDGISGTADLLPSATPVPEPSSLLLLATSIAGVGARSWRRRRREQ